MCGSVELRMVGTDEQNIVMSHSPSSFCFVKLALEWSLLCQSCLELCDLPLQLLHYCLVVRHVVVQHIADHLHTPGGGEGHCRVTN